MPMAGCLGFGGGAGDYRGADASAEGVQRDLLPLIEGCTISTKYVHTQLLARFRGGSPRVRGQGSGLEAAVLCLVSPQLAVGAHPPPPLCCARYGNVNTDYVLFISSGAFHQCKPSDLLAELQGTCSGSNLTFQFHAQLRSRSGDSLELTCSPVCVW